MRKFILLMLVSFTLAFCKNSSNVQTEQDVTKTSVISKSESDQKLIEACENMEGIVDADIKDDILTVRANISKIEAQKLSDGMLGFDLGLCGAVESEIDDIEVSLYFDGNVDYSNVDRKMKLTRKVLEYFIISNRKIDIVFYNKGGY